MFTDTVLDSVSKFEILNIMVIKDNEERSRASTCLILCQSEKTSKSEFPGNFIIFGIRVQY